MASKKSKKKPKFQTFQDTILNLQKYWSKHGCIPLQPYDMEVGAGTFHPATTRSEEHTSELQSHRPISYNSYCQSNNYSCRNPKITA